MIGSSVKETMEGEASEKKPSPPRKRRSLVAVACERCRRLKQACDGLRPSCSPCVRKNVECEYERDTREGESRQGALKRELEGTNRRLDQVADAMNFLKRVPDDRAEEIMKLIKSADDPIDALSYLHQTIQNDTALSNYTATRATFPRTGSRLAYELSISHPTYYPILIPIDQILIPVETFPDSALLQSHEPSGTNLTTAAPMDLIRESDRPSDVLGAPSVASYFASNTQRPFPGVFGPLPPSELVDRRLYFLNLRQWTEVSISDGLAAKMISLYLETDHPILGFFDADLFITALCGGLSNFCSPFLVSSLFYWICKAYTAIEPQSVSLGSQFLEEAKSRWQGLHTAEDSILTVAACMILSLGLACDGEDRLAGLFKREGTAMGERLRLSNVSKSAHEIALDESMAANAYRAKAHIAWGAFNWICLHSSNYNEQPLAHPPSFHIPGNGLPYMGHSFQAVCKFRRIVAEVFTVYNAKADQCIADRVPLSFAERKYHELLEWADNLDPVQRRRTGSPHHVMILHIWAHTAVLDIFRPFVMRGFLLQTFAAANSTPEAICEASLMQLKSLVVEYRHWQPSALYCILWHTALLYIGNAVLGSPPNNADWRFYLDLCVNTYLQLFPCYRIAAGFLQGLIFIAVKNGLLNKMEAKNILTHLSLKGRQLQAPTNATSTHIVDFELALTDKSSAQIDVLAERIEQLVTGDAPPEEGVK